MQEIRVRTERRTQLLDITGKVQEAVNDGANGATAALVFVPHTTAGVTINEHAERAVAHPRLADGPAGARASRRRPPRAGHVAGDLLLRARRAPRAHRLRDRLVLSLA